MYTKIKSFEDACKVLDINPALPDFSRTPKLQKSLEAQYQLAIITQALNGDWQPDWKDEDQLKYQLWWDMKDGGFSLFNVSVIYRLTIVPSCLCFQSREVAKYASETFYELYKSYMVVA